MLEALFVQRCFPVTLVEIRASRFPNGNQRDHKLPDAARQRPHHSPSGRGRPNVRPGKSEWQTWATFRRESASCSDIAPFPDRLLRGHRYSPHRREAVLIGLGARSKVRGCLSPVIPESRRGIGRSGLKESLLSPELQGIGDGPFERKIGSIPQSPQA